MDYNNEQLPQKHPKNGMCVASLVLGIVSIVFCCFWFISIPCSIIAIILGYIGGKAGKSGLATAGLVMGVIGLVLCIGLLILAAIGAAAGQSWLNTYGYNY